MCGWTTPTVSSTADRTSTCISSPAGTHDVFLEGAFKLPAFKAPYHAHLTEFANTLLHPERFARQVDALAAEGATSLAIGRLDVVVSATLVLPVSCVSNGA